ncbi:GNAT family N-acetyltransferase [Flavobacterium sp. KACC 22758]|uniref:GNAT family N-acetyltransferase n=1 Tax=Flavobacterium sp. KACC 22758 TaxID=3025667 RepID=UPI002366601C|nr:GNAT family N-acetyltransferase [Flavobacterium sp. KACC 22758]WDF59710.1 GNAT family N-acetyltransferase [Flavobacterium sp. KACC 22758]
MPLTGFSFSKLNTTTNILPFECGDDDLNSFLSNKAIPYKKELLATTYLLESEDKTIAYLSIYNDALAVQEKDFASKSAFNRLLKEIISHPKRHLRQFPAIKIGRLAVCESTKKERKGIGRALVNFVINLALEQNSNCACQLITVDAYSQSLDFYTKLGFKFLSDSDKGDDTRQMYLDLRPLMNTAYDISA